MANEHAGHPWLREPQPRDVARSILRGLACRCPNCGEGRLFSRFLKVAPVCTVCREDLSGSRADDLPPYVVITVVGHVIVGAVLAAESVPEWPMWLHFALWPTLTLGLALLLMQPVKGAVVGLQWALRMHGFDPSGDIHDVTMPQDAGPRGPVPGR